MRCFLDQLRDLVVLGLVFLLLLWLFVWLDPHCYLTRLPH